MYPYDDARVITVQQFKDSIINLRSSSEAISHTIKLNQLQQLLARASGFVDYQRLIKEEKLIVELPRLEKALTSICAGHESRAFYSFFRSDYITTGFEREIFVGIEELADGNLYVDPTPFTSDGKGVYRPNTMFIRLASSVTLPESSWKTFVHELAEELANTKKIATEDLCYQLPERFAELQGLEEYFPAPEYLFHYREVEELVRVPDITPGKLRKILAFYYCLDSDAPTPLSDLIDYCERLIAEEIAL